MSVGYVLYELYHIHTYIYISSSLTELSSLDSLIANTSRGMQRNKNITHLINMLNQTIYIYIYINTSNLKHLILEMQCSTLSEIRDKMAVTYANYVQIFYGIV